MKKMTKIESARIVEKQEGNCLGISCYICFNEKWCDDKGCYAPSFYCPDKLKLAQAYIKRHEGKSKKRIIPKYTADVQPDTTGSELKKIVIKPANTDPTPLDVAKIIRDKNYLCGSIDDCDNCPIRASELNSSCVENRKEKIDSYISSHEKIEPVCEHLVGDLCGNAFETCDKECLANSEILKPEPVIEPIKFQLPKIAFVVFADGIGVRSKNFTIDSDGNLTHSGCLCYDNIDKAVAVWNATYGKEVKK